MSEEVPESEWPTNDDVTNSEPQKEEEPKQKKTRTRKQTAPLTQIKLKHGGLQWHHLYKADLRKAKKNIDFRANMVNLVDMEHVHFFHSINSQGKTQKYTNAVGGHFHEITTYVDDKGNMKARCGEALRYIDRRKPDGSVRKVLQKVEFYDGMDGMNGRTYPDDHIHQVDYIASEEIEIKKRGSVIETKPKNIEGFKIL